MSASILVVDDDPPFRAAVRRALLSAGRQAEEATDGAQAMRALEARAYDLVITDLIMENGDGIELIRAIKVRRPDTPILAVSGRGSFRGVDMLRMAAMVGADATLAKPLDSDVLMAVVNQLLGLEAV